MELCYIFEIKTKRAYIQKGWRFKIARITNYNQISIRNRDHFEATPPSACNGSKSSSASSKRNTKTNARHLQVHCISSYTKQSPLSNWSLEKKYKKSDGVEIAFTRTSTWREEVWYNQAWKVSLSFPNLTSWRSRLHLLGAVVDGTWINISIIKQQCNFSW